MRHQLLVVAEAGWNHTLRVSRRQRSEAGVVTGGGGFQGGDEVGCDGHMASKAPIVLVS